jgi:hypothetical protein
MHQTLRDMSKPQNQENLKTRKPLTCAFTDHMVVMFTIGIDWELNKEERMDCAALFSAFRAAKAAGKRCQWKGGHLFIDRMLVPPRVVENDPAEGGDWILV